MLGVSQIGLSVTTMDDVFLKIGEMVDAQVALKSNFVEIWLPEKITTSCPGPKWGGRSGRGGSKRLGIFGPRG